MAEYCRKGHEYTPENTRYETRDGKTTRRCLACRRARNRAWYEAHYVKTPRTHCRNGHEYTPENTTIDSRGYRRCFICSVKTKVRRVATKPVILMTPVELELKREWRRGQYQKYTDEQLARKRARQRRNYLNRTPEQKAAIAAREKITREQRKAGIRLREPYAPVREVPRAAG